MDERAIELRLAVLVVSDRRVELVDPFERHDIAEKGDRRRGPDDIDMEVRPREAEHDRYLVGGRQYGVDKDAVLAVEQREHERELSAVARETTDNVRPFVAIEDAREDLRALDGRRAECLLCRAGDRGADACGIAIGIGESVAKVCEQAARERLVAM